MQIAWFYVQESPGLPNSFTSAMKVLKRQLEVTRAISSLIATVCVCDGSYGGFLYANICGEMGEGGLELSRLMLEIGSISSDIESRYLARWSLSSWCRSATEAEEPRQ